MVSISIVIQLLDEPKHFIRMYDGLISLLCLCVTLDVVTEKKQCTMCSFNLNHNLNRSLYRHPNVILLLFLFCQVAVFSQLRVVFLFMLTFHISVVT